jgi:PE family
MSSETGQPEALAALARFAGLAPALNATNIAATTPTAGMVPAAADDVSAIMAAQFAIQAQIYQAASAQLCQALSAQAMAAVQELFASPPTDSGDSGAATEGTDAAAGV